MIWLEDKEELRSVDTQYYFGDDIVIAPVLRPRMEKHTLYIPEVELWFLIGQKLTYSGNMGVGVELQRASDWPR